MYNMYSKTFESPIFDRTAKKPYEENHSLDGAGNGRRSCVQNEYFLVPHEEVTGSNTGRGQQLKVFQFTL